MVSRNIIFRKNIIEDYDKIFNICFFLNNQIKKKLYEKKIKL